MTKVKITCRGLSVLEKSSLMLNAVVRASPSAYRTEFIRYLLNIILMES